MRQETSFLIRSTIWLKFKTEFRKVARFLVCQVHCGDQVTVKRERRRGRTRREREENARRVNRKRGIRKTGKIRRKVLPYSAYARTKKKTMFNCFSLGAQSTLVRFNFVSPSFQSVANLDRTVDDQPKQIRFLIFN